MIDTISQTPVEAPQSPSKRFEGNTGRDIPTTANVAENGSQGVLVGVDELTSQEDGTVLSSVDNLTTKAHSPGYTVKKALELTLLKKIIDPNTNSAQDYEESKQEVARSDNLDEAIERYRKTLSGQESEAVIQGLETSISNGIVTNPGQVKEELDFSESIDNENPGKFEKEKVIVDYYGSPDLTEKVRLNIAAINYKWSGLAEYAESVGKFHKYFVQPLSLLFVPDFFDDLSDLTGTSLFKGPGELKNFIHFYQQLDGDQKAEAIDNLLPKLEEAYEGNIYKMAIVLELLDHPKYDSAFNIEGGFAVLDLASIGLDVFTLTKILSRVRFTKIMAGMGAKREAAEAVVAAGTPKNPGTGVGFQLLDNPNKPGTQQGPPRLGKGDIIDLVKDPDTGTWRMEPKNPGTGVGFQLLEDPNKPRGTWKENPNKPAEEITDLVEDPNNPGTYRDPTEAPNNTVTRGAENPEEVLIAGNRLDRAMSRTPFNMEDTPIGIGSTDGLAAEITKIEDSIKANAKSKIEEPLETLKEGTENLHLGALTDSEKKATIEGYISDLGIEAKRDALLYTNIKVEKIDDRGFTIKYTIDDPKTDDLPTQEITTRRVWRATDAGTFQALNPNFKGGTLYNVLGSFFLSPELRLHSLSDKIVPQFTEIARQSSKTANILQKAWNNLDKGLSRNEKIRVNELLLSGDEREKAYSVSELLRGVELESGYTSYTSKEIEAYQLKLLFNKELHTLRNHTVKRKLELLGARELNFTYDDSARKVVGIPKSSWNGITIKNDELVLFPQQDNKNFLQGLSFNLHRDKYIKEGYKPVQILDDFNADGKTVKWAIIKDDGPEGSAFLKDLPDQVLNYAGDHYVPRIRTPGYYYVKDASFNEDGVPVSRGATLKAARTKKEADAWVANFNKEQEANGTKDGNRLNPQVFRDRDLSVQQALVEDANQYGGLYTGARKSERLTDVHGNPLKRLDPGPATQRYLTSLAEEMTLNEYRMGLVQRYKNSVDAFARAEGKPFGLSPNEDWKKAEILISDGKTKKLFEQTRSYIIKQAKIWNDEERAWNVMMMDLAEHMDGNYLLADKLHDTAVALSHTEQLKNLRALAFGVHMGWFNISQFYVQSQNASIAIAIDPINAPRAFWRSLAMRSMMFLPDQASVERAAKIAGNVDGSSPEEMVELLKLFQRSGFRDAIDQVADNDAIREGFSPGTLDSFRKLMGLGLIFYREGELTARLNAWNIARLRIAGDKAAKDISDEELLKIDRETDRLHINMQNTNAADYQKNPITALPFQFEQILFKFFEKVLPALFRRGDADTAGGQWTRAEAARVLGAQYAFYGIAGTPLIGGVYFYIARLLGTSPEEVAKEHPYLAEGISDGAAGVMAKALGFENQFGGDRTNIVAGMDDTVFWAWGKAIRGHMNGEAPDTPLVTTMFGASANVVGRTSDALSTVTNGFRVLFETPSLETLGDVTIESLSDIAAITSSWNNARKGWALHQTGQILTKSGKPHLNKENTKDINLRTALGVAAGFSSDRQIAVYDLQKFNLRSNKEKRNTKKSLRKAYHNYFKDDNLEKLKFNMAYALQGYTGLEQDQLIIELMDELQRGESEEDRQLAAHIKRVVGSGGRVGSPANIGALVPKKDKEEKQ